MNLEKCIKNKKGSYIVEAALTLPLFILCVTALALTIKVISICENIGFVTAGEIRELDVSAYQLQVLEKPGMTTVSELLIEEAVLAENPALTEFKVINLDYLYTDGGIEDLIAIETDAVFTVDNPAGIYGRIEFRQKLLTRGFTGSFQDGSPLSAKEFMDDKAGGVVWVFPKYGIRFHRPDCYYVKKDYEGEEYKLEMQKEDAVRKGYTPCLVCGGKTDE